MHGMTPAYGVLRTPYGFSHAPLYPGVMTRPVAVLTLVVLVTVATGVTGVAGSVGGNPSAAVAAAETMNRTNTSDVLRLPSINRSAVATPDLDLSTALSMQDVRTHWRLLGYTVEERFDHADSEADRRAILTRAVNRAEQGVTVLRQQQRRALTAYTNGSIDGERLLARLGQLQTAARALDGFVSLVSRLNQVNATATDETVKNRLLRVRAELAMVVSPVRSLVADAVAGQAPMPTLFVGVGDTGVTLSTVRAGTFLHDTVRLDHFADQPGSSNASEALARWAELYPEVWDDGLVDFTGLNGAYRAALPFDGGHLVSYLDATTLTVYSETQSKTVTALPTGPPVTSSRDELVVTVNRTYPGGPLRVSFHSDTGEPLDGVVRVNGRRVGRTGADGVLWTIGPAEQFAVTVDYGDRQVALVVTPTTA